MRRLPRRSMGWLAVASGAIGEIRRLAHMRSRSYGLSVARLRWTALVLNLLNSRSKRHSTVA